MSQDSREQFEQEWEKVCGHRPTRSIALGGENSYEGRAEAAWWGWQASRAAVVVELPKDITVGSDIVSGVYHNDYNRRVREAIEAAGVKVAP